MKNVLEIMNSECKVRKEQKNNNKHQQKDNCTPLHQTNRKRERKKKKDNCITRLSLSLSLSLSLNTEHAKTPRKMH
ncbi:hypothetical protein E2C01_021255 [Portunus trituberculatus]|uniref:Uncharacterized protein n=1 Tax=Portunus trituberculatus TaxID=210409 RepID=A0A5B7E250_PORTR|nr:hypothetical protein [Portunus trituberculatus]